MLRLQPEKAKKFYKVTEQPASGLVGDARALLLGGVWREELPWRRRVFPLQLVSLKTSKCASLLHLAQFVFIYLTAVLVNSALDHLQ